MIRPFTCVCMLLAAGSGLYLYQTKHRAQLLDRDIQRTMKQAEVVRDRIGVLKGEWAFLSEPDRLTELSRQHLTLRPMLPTQVVAMADLAAHLPPPAAPGSVPQPHDEPVDLPPMIAARQSPAQVAAVTAPTKVAVATVTSTAPALPPKDTSSPAKPAAKPTAVAHAAEPEATPAAPPTPVRAARPTAPILTVSAGPIGGGNLIGESVARVARGLPPLGYHGGGLRAEPAPMSATPVVAHRSATPPAYAAPAYAAPAYAAPAYVPPAYVPAYAANAGGASALGGSRSALPPPVPYNAIR